MLHLPRSRPRTVFAAALFATSFIGTSGRARAATPIVVVYDIEDKGADLDAGLRDRLSEYLASSLAATGAYQVVPRSQLKQRLSQAKHESYKRCYDQSCQVEIGRELAAGKSLATQLIKLGSLCMVTAVMYDLSKSASEGGARAEGACDEAAVVGSIKQVIARLVPGARRGPPEAAAPSSTTPTQPTVSVDLATEPPGAELFINGSARGRTPARLALARGSYDLTLEKSGYSPVRERLQVSDRVSRSFQLALTAQGRAALRTRTEWFGIEAMGGAVFNDAKGTEGAGGGLLTIVTFKWPWFFWSVFEAGASGGSELGAVFIASRVGLPLYFGEEGAHQLRFGLGFGPGAMGREGDGGMMLTPTAHYHYQGQRHFIGFGVRMVIPVVGDFSRFDDTTYHPVAVFFTVPMGWVSRPD